jgi:hypothetical protein
MNSSFSLQCPASVVSKRELRPGRQKLTPDPRCFWQKPSSGLCVTVCVATVCPRGPGTRRPTSRRRSEPLTRRPVRAGRSATCWTSCDWSQPAALRGDPVFVCLAAFGSKNARRNTRVHTRVGYSVVCACGGTERDLSRGDKWRSSSSLLDLYRIPQLTLLLK